jgi:large subunit ribosomal protein L24
MKLKRGDKVIVIQGRDKGKTSTITAVLPATGQVVVENLNIAKRHTKPSQKQPRGGILEITKPLAASKVMALDPTTGKPARIGYVVKADGTKERIFKVSPNHEGKLAKAKKADKAAKPAAKAKPTKATKDTKPKPKPGTTS